MADGKKFNAGDKFTKLPRQTWNGMVDVYNSQRAPDNLPRVARSNHELVTNTTANNVPAYYAFGFPSDPVVPFADNPTGYKTQPVYKGIEPTKESFGKWGIIPGPLSANATGAIQVSGVCLAMVDIVNQAHQRCEIEPGSHVLQSRLAGGSAEILLRETQIGVGPQLCWIRIGDRAVEPNILYKVITRISAASFVDSPASTSCSDSGFDTHVKAGVGSVLKMELDSENRIVPVCGAVAEMAYNYAPEPSTDPNDVPILLVECERLPSGKLLYTNEPCKKYKFADSSGAE